MIPSYGSQRSSPGEMRRRNKRLILVTLILLVILVYITAIRRKMEKADDENFPPERWTIDAPASGEGVDE